jgi:hypothetical protein
MASDRNERPGQAGGPANKRQDLAAGQDPLPGQPAERQDQRALGEPQDVAPVIEPMIEPMREMRAVIRRQHERPQPGRRPEPAPIMGLREPARIVAGRERLVDERPDLAIMAMAVVRLGHGGQIQAAGQDRGEQHRLTDGLTHSKAPLARFICNFAPILPGAREPGVSLPFIPHSPARA